VQSRPEGVFDVFNKGIVETPLGDGVGQNSSK
jgi:hypothetical protein